MRPTERLDFTDPLRHTFTAQVLAVQGQEVTLDASAFYPQSGGQNADTGLLRWTGGEARVTDVRVVKGEGVVWHTLDTEGALPTPGTPVHGEIDAGRRWRHMQRHTAEHLLAQAFRRVNPAFEVAAVSMGSAECHLDLKGDPADTHVQAAEALLRETLGRTELTLETPVVPDHELHRYPLRREAKVSGQVRLVIFRDASGEPFDVSACGGTHVPRAAQCGPVVVLRTERQKAGLTRVVFMAGEEAAAHLSGLHRRMRALAQDFSVPVEGLPERVQATVVDLSAAQAEAERLRTRLAAALVQAQNMAGPCLTLTLDPEDASLLTPALRQVPAGRVLIACTPDGGCGVASAHPAVPAGEVLREVLALTGGRGGGKPDLAQGRTEQPGLFARAAVEAVQARLSAPRGPAA